MNDLDSLRRSIAANDTAISIANTVTMVGLFMTFSLAIPALIGPGIGLALGLALGGLVVTGIVGAFCSYRKGLENAGLRATLVAEEKTAAEPAVPAPTRAVAKAAAVALEEEAPAKPKWGEQILAETQTAVQGARR